MRSESNEIYKGPHLRIEYIKGLNRFINSWITSPKTIEVCKNEMLQFLAMLEKNNPSQVLWLQQNFTLKIDEAMNAWVEENILIPRFEAGFITQDQNGFHHIAFVVGEDVIAHINVMAASSQSVFKPRHFATRQEAEGWLDRESLPDKKEKLIGAKIIYKGVDENGNAVIEVRNPASELGNMISSFKRIMKENEFTKENIVKFSSLSPRERETLLFIIQGNTNEEIANKMCVSPNTIRTHRNRIWKKLKIKNVRDCFDYECFYENPV